MIVAQLKFAKQQYISLQSDGQWIPSKPGPMESLASIANNISLPPFYQYSPSHGAFGPLLAYQIHKKLGGKLFLRKRDPNAKEPKGIVF